MIFDYFFFAENFYIPLIIPEVVQKVKKRNNAVCKNTFIDRMENNIIA